MDHGQESHYDSRRGHGQPGEHTGTTTGSTIADEDMDSQPGEHTGTTTVITIADEDMDSQANTQEQRQSLR